MQIDDAVEFIRREYAELPGLKLTLALLLVRAQERGDVASIIDRLEAAPEVNAYLGQLRASVRAPDR